MTGYHNITSVPRAPRNGWKIIHFSQFSGGQEIITSFTVGLPGIFIPAESGALRMRENIHIRGFGKDLAEEILDGLVSFMFREKKIIEPGDTIKCGERKFLVLREGIPPSICTRERSILVLRFLEPTERQL